MFSVKWPEGSASTNRYLEPYDENLDQDSENEEPTRSYDRSRDLGRLVRIADTIAAMDFAPGHTVMIDVQYGEIEYAYPACYTGKQMQDVEDTIAEIMDQDLRTGRPIQQPSIFTIFNE